MTLMTAASPEAAVAKLDALERVTPVRDAWHAKHRLVARGSDAQSLEIVAAAVRDGSAGEAHFGQFALALMRQRPAREVAAELERSPRLAAILDEIDALPDDLRPHRKRLSELDLSWAIEALAIGRAARGRPLAEEWRDARGRRVSILTLIDANRRLLTADEAEKRMHFVPEYGVHALMMLCRVVTLHPSDPATEQLRLEADRLFAYLAHGSGDPRRFTPSLLSLAAHLLEIAFDPGAYRPRGVDAARLDALAAELVQRIEQDEAPRDYGFVTHALRGLRNYLARTDAR